MKQIDWRVTAGVCHHHGQTIRRCGRPEAIEKRNIPEPSVGNLLFRGGNSRASLGAPEPGALTNGSASQAAVRSLRSRVVLPLLAIVVIGSSKIALSIMSMPH